MKASKTVSHTICRHEEKLAELARGISHPLRVEIVRMLANRKPDRPCICGDIVNALPLAQSTVSQHLKVLRETGWITGESMGTSIRYCLVEGVCEEYEKLLERVLNDKRPGPFASPRIEKMMGGPDGPEGEKHVRSDGKGN